MTKQNTTTWSGDGKTEATAYQISTEQQLIELTKAVNSGMNFKGEYLKLTSDIDKTRPWAAIGTKKNSFQGTFDGDNHFISHVFSKKGLFGYALDATIKNLSIKGVFKGKYCVGAVASEIKNSVIDNCHGWSEVAALELAGGIVGLAQNSLVINCSNGGSVATVEMSGGIVGLSDKSSVVNCCNHSVSASLDFYCGGIVGMNEGKCLITNCYSVGDIYKQSYLGSIAGCIDQGAVTNCYALSDAPFIASETDEIIENYICDEPIVINEDDDDLEITNLIDVETMTQEELLNALNANAEEYNKTATVKAKACTIDSDNEFPKLSL